MSSSNQPRTVLSDDTVGDTRTPPPSFSAGDEAVHRAFVSQATIEQVKGVIVAVRGVDEATATETLVAAAKRGGTSLRLAADQVMTELRTGRDGAAVTQEALTEALDAVRPRERRRGHDPLLSRGAPRSGG